MADWLRSDEPGRSWSRVVRIGLVLGVVIGIAAVVWALLAG